MQSGGLLEHEDTHTSMSVEYSEPGDEDRFSHYVRKVDIERAVFDGIPCVALCGKKWLPQRDYTKFPVCPECKQIFEETKFTDDK